MIMSLSVVLLEQLLSGKKLKISTLGSGYRGIGCKVIPAIGALFFGPEWTLIQ